MACELTAKEWAAIKENAVRRTLKKFPGEFADNVDGARLKRMIERELKRKKR